MQVTANYFLFPQKTKVTSLLSVSNCNWIIFHMNCDTFSLVWGLLIKNNVVRVV